MATKCEKSNLPQLKIRSKYFTWVLMLQGPPVVKGQFVAVKRLFRVWLCQGPTTQGFINIGYQKDFPF
jgi:hypothetical protein